MRNEPRTKPGEFDQDQARRAQLLRTILVVATAASLPAIAVFAVLGYSLPEFPAVALAMPLLASLAGNVLSFWLLRRGHLTWAVHIFVFVQSLAVLALIALVGGATGPLVPALVTIAVTAALLMSRSAARWTITLAGLLYVALAVLEEQGLWLPRSIPAGAARMSLYSVSLVALAVTGILVTQLAQVLQRALAAAERRSRELMEARQQSDQAARAEREARERERKIALELNQAVQTIIDFLDQVAEGDYTARLPVEQAEGALAPLGRRLNETVETLIRSLEEVQAVQRRYVREAWAEYSQAAERPRGFRYDGARIKPAADAWLPPMAEAIQAESPTAGAQELALPITLRGEVIGALGARREGGAGWSPEELALAGAVADQLAQTLDNLRLLDEAQRRAMREQRVGRLADQMQRAASLDHLLRIAAEELGHTLGATHAVVQLGTEDELGGQS